MARFSHPCYDRYLLMRQSCRCTHLPVSLRAFRADAPGELGVSRQVAPHALSIQRPESWDAAAGLLRAAWQQSALQPPPMQQNLLACVMESSRPAAAVFPSKSYHTRHAPVRMRLVISVK